MLSEFRPRDSKHLIEVIGSRCGVIPFRNREADHLVPGGPIKPVDAKFVGQVESLAEEEVGEDGHGRVGVGGDPPGKGVEMMLL